MRIAIVSDLHGNLVALEAVLADLTGQAPDLVLHGGDLATAGPRPVEVVDRVRELGWRGVRGNTDEIPYTRQLEARVRAGAPRLGRWLDAMFGTLGPWSAERLGEERTRWLHALPERLSEEDLRLVHASPGDLWKAPMPDVTPAQLDATYGQLGGRIVAYGHIHRPFARQTDHGVVANCGSAGFPWDGDPRAAYLVIDGGPPRVRRVAFDVDRAASDARDAGFPLAGWLEQVYRTGAFSVP
ncbi:MAG: metallophosphoesterase family protein [Candidatus Dormibacteraeota bacterium]|nr:metallophosphoesterase family protein [Candidatus Dormibacteraeota bacterium]MBO0744396.1 metallophosphoesterase family protein [Candidatus Dormibacteraeota bacterium]